MDETNKLSLVALDIRLLVRFLVSHLPFCSSVYIEIFFEVRLVSSFRLYCYTSPV